MAVAVVVLAAMAVYPGVASAHVTVHPDHVARGASDVELTFRSPNERRSASIVVLRVFLPATTRLLGVLSQPIPGWTATERTTLPHPVTTDDGVNTSAVCEITWFATGTGIAKHEYTDFPIAVGTMPDVTGPIVFKALQTYSDGMVIAWIQVADALDALDANPPMPAPVLTLSSPSIRSQPASQTAIDLALAALVVAAAALSVSACSWWRGAGGDAVRAVRATPFGSVHGRAWVAQW